MASSGNVDIPRATTAGGCLERIGDEALAGRSAFDISAPTATWSAGGDGRPRRLTTMTIARATIMVTMAQAGGNEQAAEMLMDDDPRGVTFWDAVGNLVIALVGGAILVLPSTMARVGWLAGPILLVVSAASMVECGRLICHACELAEQHAGARAGSLKSYEELAAAVGWKRILMLTKNIVMLGGVAMLMTVVSGSIATFFPGGTDAAPTKFIRFGMVMPNFILLAMAKDLQQLARLNFLGIICVGVEVIGLLSGTIVPCVDPTWCRKEGEEEKSCAWYSWAPPTDSIVEPIGLATSVFVFSFAVLATLPSIRAQMEAPEEMPAAFSTAMGVTAVLYLFVMVTGYVAYGQEVKENLLVPISEQYNILGAVTSVGIVFNLLLTGAIMLYCVISVIEAQGTWAIHQQLSLSNTALRAAIVVLLAFIGYLVPDLGAMIGLVSSLFCVWNNLFYPIIFYYALRRKVESAVPRVFCCRTLFHVLLALFGAGVMVFGFSGSLRALRGPSSAAASSSAAATTTTTTSGDVAVAA